MQNPTPEASKPLDTPGQPCQKDGEARLAERLRQDTELRKRLWLMSPRCDQE